MNYSTSKAGLGWKTSVQQSIVSQVLTGNNNTNQFYLIYTDGDGTEHYFSPKKGSTTVYEDEDGLGLTITISGSQNTLVYTMKDQNGSTWTFHLGYLTSYKDANGNALYYAYNGQDYSTTNTTWRPSTSNTAYRVTSVWRQNNGSTIKEKLAALNYDSAGQLISVTDNAGRTTTLTYKNDELQTVTFPDENSASYTYSIVGKQHFLISACDNESGYRVNYIYHKQLGQYRIYRIQEYTRAETDSWTAGQTIRSYKSEAHYSRFRYYGADGTADTSDDLVCRYYFDAYGRTLNAVSYNYDETQILGVSVGSYTQNSGTNKTNNRLTAAASSGIQSVNLLHNAGLELPDESQQYRLRGWTHTGAGAAAIRPTSESSSTSTEVKPRTGKEFLKLYNGNTTLGVNTAYQEVYLFAGQTYVFSAYVNTACATIIAENGGAYLTITDTNGNSMATSQIIGSKTGTDIDKGWRRLEVSFRPTASGTYRAAVNIRHLTQVAVFDDMQLEQIADTVSVTAGLTPEGTASTANLLQCGSFDTSTHDVPASKELSKTYWAYNAAHACPTYFDAQRHCVMTFASHPDGQRRASQTVTLNQPSSVSYLLSGWGKTNAAPADSKQITGDNSNYTRFFGMIVKLIYADTTTPEYQYVSFAPDCTDWQYISGVIVPKREGKIVTSITVTLACDYEPNRAWMDDISLVKEPVQSYSYDENGNLVAASDSKNSKTSATYDSSDRLTQYTDMNGVSTALTYENNTIRNPATVTTDTIKTAYAYDPAGNITTTTTQSTTGSSYLQSDTIYNNAKNFCVQMTDVNGATKKQVYYEKEGLLAQSIDGKGNVTRYHYDDAERPQEQFQPGVADVTNSYERGVLTTLTRKSKYNGTDRFQRFSFTYNDWGQTTAIAVSRGTSADHLSAGLTLASYTYADQGNLTKMTYGNGQYVTYSYDLFDRLVKETYYDENGNVQVTYLYVYNADGQLGRQYALNANGSKRDEYTYEYDSLGRLICSQETKNSAKILSTYHLYDTANRLTRQSWTLGSTAFSEHYTYDDKDGSLSSVTTATGDQLNYTYDALERLSKVTATTADGTAIFSTAQAYQTVSGSQTSMQVQFYNVKTPAGAVISGSQYKYDANGNVTEIRESLTPYRLLVAYEYDNLNQLTKETQYSYSGTDTTPTKINVFVYTYDTAGNILTCENGINITTYTYDDANWQDKLTRIEFNDQEKFLTYDEMGNPLYWNNNETSFSELTWEQGRRLTALNTTTATTQQHVLYSYDMFGTRSYKSVKDSATKKTEVHNYITQNGKVIRETIGSGATAQILDFIYDSIGRPFALKYSKDNGATFVTYYYILTMEGDVIGLMDANCKVKAAYTYDAWGRIVKSAGSMSVINPLRYRGYYYDNETGWYYLQSRYYDPVVKRFINADSYGSTGTGFLGYNMFAYCDNNPVVRVDTQGEGWFSALCDIVSSTVATFVTTGSLKEAGETFVKSSCKAFIEEVVLKPVKQAQKLFHFGCNIAASIKVYVDCRNSGASVGASLAASAINLGANMMVDALPNSMKKYIGDNKLAINSATATFGYPWVVISEAITVGIQQNAKSNSGNNNGTSNKPTSTTPTTSATTVSSGRSSGGGGRSGHRSIFNPNFYCLQ